MWLLWLGGFFMAVIALCVVFLLAMSTYQVLLMVQYRRLRGPDPEPTDRFAEADLPRVTVQLPVYNEGQLAERILRHAAALDYPRDRLQVQFLNDSTEPETTRIALETIATLRQEQPDLEITYHHRDSREGFKAGALLNGAADARGEFHAIFDADFLIPPDYLRRTVHYFKDPHVALVQARWDYTNRNATLLTRLQAVKLDSHQMFEQTARARSSLPVIFHGTAGVWRAAAIEQVGGWDCFSEVEDVEVSVRSLTRGWRFIYLDHLRIASELPVTLQGYLRQQMRWKRGWTRLALNYTGMIFQGRMPVASRLDLLQRIHMTWGPAGALIMTLGALPFFIVAARFGLILPAVLLYMSGLVLSLVGRMLEERTLREDPMFSKTEPLPPWLRFLPLGYLMGLGTGWALTQATFEGLMPGRVWEVTPKSGASRAGANPSKKAGLPPLYTLGTLGIGLAAIILAALSIVFDHPLAMIFYGMLIMGSGWIGLGLLREHRPSWFAWLPAFTTDDHKGDTAVETEAASLPAQPPN